MNKRMTQVVGNGALVRLRVVRTACCRLASVIGVNNGADSFIQIHETAAEPADQAVPLLHFPIDAARAFALALPVAVDLSAVTVVASSTLATYTAVAGTPVSIQGILEV